MSSVARRRSVFWYPLMVSSFLVLGIVVWLRLPDNSSILAKSGQAFAAAISEPPTHEMDLAKLAEKDPLGVLNLAIQRYNVNVRDYTCLFTKTELLPDGPTPEQQIEVLFKENPFSVLMNFVKNPGPAQKILFVQGQNNGEAVIRPAGVVLSLLVPSVTRPVNGPDAMKNSRKTIDKFGLGNSLLMLRDVAVKAKDNGELIHLKYLGQREVDGRKTFAFERRIVENTERYPDSICVYHLDQEWLLPTAVTCLSADGTLLGKYLFSNLKLNVGLTDKQFTRKVNGL